MGFSVLHYLTLRAILAMLSSLFLSLALGRFFEYCGLLTNHVIIAIALRVCAIYFCLALSPLEDCSCYAMKCFNKTYELSPGKFDCHVCYLSHALRMQFVLFYFLLATLVFQNITLNRRRTDNTTDKRKRSEGQTTIYKTYLSFLYRYYFPFYFWQEKI
jgi:hypothetical protein